MRLEVVEGLEAVVTAHQRLARRRAELRHESRRARPASRACDRCLRAPQRAHARDIDTRSRHRRATGRRGDAVFAELAAAFCRDPVGRPRRRERDVEPSIRDAGHRKDRKSTRLNSSHVRISYAVFCLKKKKTTKYTSLLTQKKKKK